MEYWIDFAVEVAKDLTPTADALAWPIVVLVLGFVFRTSIANLLDRVTRIRSGDHEIELGRQIAEAVETSESIPVPKELPSIEEQLTSEWRHFAPLGAIVETWLLVEKKLLELGVAREVHTRDSSRRRTAYQVAIELERIGAIDGSVHSTVRFLRDARNRAVHDPDVSVREGEALEYQHAAARVIAFISDELDKSM